MLHAGHYTRSPLDPPYAAPCLKSDEKTADTTRNPLRCYTRRQVLFRSSSSRQYHWYAPRKGFYLSAIKTGSRSRLFKRAHPTLDEDGNWHQLAVVHFKWLGKGVNDPRLRTGHQDLIIDEVVPEETGPKTYVGGSREENSAKEGKFWSLQGPRYCANYITGPIPKKSIPFKENESAVPPGVKDGTPNGHPVLVVRVLIAVGSLYPVNVKAETTITIWALCHTEWSRTPGLHECLSRGRKRYDPRSATLVKTGELVLNTVVADLAQQHLSTLEKYD
ncbi:hypothetical protein B0H14DRAFT_2605500 [Mycena olivaceomarginata]|nr:hypothetical protein B0H14DRAFT_2605500 [Mycena olivaceomarginata]